MQDFYCEFCEIFENTFFTEHLRATTSEKTYPPSNLRQKLTIIHFPFQPYIRIKFLFILHIMWLQMTSERREKASNMKPKYLFF